MSSYFDHEMRLLQDAARDFARAFPEKARYLNLLDIKDRDPYVERLLEGMAFLTADVKRRINDDIPEFSEALLTHIRPCFLRPFPSCTIMQYTPRAGQLRQTTVIPKGTVTSGAGVTLPGQGRYPLSERILCRYRSTSTTVIQPLRLAAASVEAEQLQGQSLCLHFQFDHQINPRQLDFSQLKIYLHGDAVSTLELFRTLTAEVQRLEVSFPGLVSRPHRLGGQERLRPCHLGCEDLLLPASGRGFLGFHLLQDYFCFREKYQFVTITGLEQIVWPDNCCEFELRIHLNKPLADELRLSRDNFRLHCTPAINLFEETSEPIRLDHKHSEYHVVADNNAPRGAVVYQVNKVSGNKFRDGTSNHYQPLHRFNHLDRSQRYFHVSHRQREELGPMTYLRLGGAPVDQEEILTCDITVCNGDIPHHSLKVGEINAPDHDFPTNIVASNLTRPSRMHMPPARPDYRLALVSHLTVNYNSIASINQLQQLLSLYNWSEQKQSAKRILGLTDITLQALSKVYRGALLRGVDIRLEMDEKAFLTEADAYLFTTVLHHFFSMYVSINTFVQTGLQLSPSRTEYLWEPILGDNFLI